jgi:hypothetical protein
VGYRDPLGYRDLWIIETLDAAGIPATRAVSDGIINVFASVAVQKSASILPRVRHADF